MAGEEGRPNRVIWFLLGGITMAFVLIGPQGMWNKFQAAGHSFESWVRSR
jgi:hypothetical protein